MIESFQIDNARGIRTPLGFSELPEGSWFGSYKVENDEVWQQVKDGTFQGFSVEGQFDLELLRHEDDEIVDKLMDKLKASAKELNEFFNSK